jgi:hypothetical protein
MKFKIEGFSVMGFFHGNSRGSSPIAGLRHSWTSFRYQVQGFGEYPILLVRIHRIPDYQ